MNEQGFNFSWLAALILAVPLAIVGNVLTRVWERWLEKRPQRKISSKAKSLRARIKRAETALERYGGATDYLINQIALSLAITAYVASAAAMIFGSSQLLLITPGIDGLDEEKFIQILTVMGTLISAQGGLFAVSTLTRGARVAKDIRNLAAHVTELEDLETRMDG